MTSTLKSWMVDKDAMEEEARASSEDGVGGELESSTSRDGGSHAFRDVAGSVCRSVEIETVKGVRPDVRR